MRVAWDLQAVTGPRPTGLGVSVAFLLRAFEEHCGDCELIGLRPNQQNRALTGVPSRVWWEQLRLPLALRREHRRAKLDLCYSPALGAPLFSPVPVVAHVHDLISLHYPQQFRGVAGWYWKRLLPDSWRRCAALTVSNEAVAEDVSRLLWFERERIHIVPYYPDPQLAALAGAREKGEGRRSAEVRKRGSGEAGKGEGRREKGEERSGEGGASGAEAPATFITLATHEPRKNIELAIRGLGRLRRHGVKATLLCIGGHTAHTGVLKALADSERVADSVSFPGYLDREETEARLAGCTALVFASRYEGFGLPPLEAMSLGAAVVLSDIPCHRVVYTDPERWADCGRTPADAPELVGVDNVEALAAEMARLALDGEYRELKRQAGLAYASTFTAAATAKALRAAFAAALNQR